MKKRINLLIVLCIISSIFLFSNTTLVHASTNSNDYTDLLDDLRKDNNFEISNYPSLTINEVMNSDYHVTLKIIQIAESSSKELYLYVYQPINNDLFFTATSISMSCEYSDNGEGLHPRNYNIELVSSYDVFCKYVVKDFVVSDEAYRYYNIVCIRRNFDYTFDDKITGTEDDGNEKAIDVGQQWCCYYLNNKLIYEMCTFDTLEIDVKYTGNFDLSSGIKWGNLAGMYDFGKAWFICFDLEDYIATHIYDADLSYKIRTANRSVGLGLSGEIEYGNFSDDIYIILTDMDEVSYNGGGLFAKEYKWNRIMSSEAFINNAEDQKINVPDEVKHNILNSQWVFAFCETETTVSTGSGYTFTYGYDVADVTILRVHFLTKNGAYDLGVVSDRVNPDNKSDGFGGIDTDYLEEWFSKLFMIIGIILLIMLLSVSGPVISFIIKIIIFVFKIIFKVVSLPFKLINTLFFDKKKKP